MAKRDSVEYRIQNITRAVMSRPWLCHPGKLEEMRAFLEFRASGGRLEEHVVKEAFAPAQGSEIFHDDSGRRIDVDGIRYVPIMGIMSPKINLMTQLSGGTSTKVAMQDVRKGLADDAVSTILLHIDSPGGVSTLVPELAQTILDGRGKKRIIAIGEGMMASAALWVGTAATEVFASASTEVGSQGAYMVVMTDVDAATQAGETFHVIRAGEFKAVGIRHEPLSESGRAELQRGIDELDQQFVAALAEQRNVSEEFVRDRFGRGKVFSAQDAFERKLIDGVMMFDELIDRERSRNSTATTVSLKEGKFMNVTPKVKAAMYANGCIDAIDASDEVCVAYLRGVAKISGKSYEEASEQELIALALGNVSEKRETTTGIDHKGKEYTAEVLDAGPSADQVRAEARARTAEIQLLGKELGVPAQVVLAAVGNSDKSMDEIRQEFTEYAAGDSGAVGVYVTESGADKVVSGLTGALLDRLGRGNLATENERENGRSFESATMLEMARTALQSAGKRLTGDREKDAREFLALGAGVGTKNAHSIRYAMNEPVYNRMGDHPDALSNLMGRILDDAYDEAPQTYTVFTKRVPDVPDTRPKTFIERGVFQELDAIGEDEPHKQLKFESAIKAVIQVAKYGDKAALTELMVINDDLGIFEEQLSSLQAAAVNTIDNTCRSLLVSNPTLIDGTKMFAAAKGNIIATGSGGAPSDAQVSEHRRLHRLIKGYGSSRTINRPPTKSLHPAAQERVARQVLLSNASDAKVAETDANINTVRGTIMPTIDGMLDGYTTPIAGNLTWWTFVEGIEPLIVAFLLGKGGPTGMRTTWTDPDTGSRYVAIDMWAGIAPLNWRGTVYNEGA